MCSTCETMQRRIVEAYLQGYEEGLIDGAQLESASHLGDGEESPTNEATNGGAARTLMPPFDC